MRRLLAVSVMLVAVVASAACSPKAGSVSAPSWSSPPKAAGPDTSAGSTYTVCGAVRTAVTTDMTPLGKALGAIVGNATAGDGSGRKAAETQAATALTKLGTDITAAAGSAKDAKVKNAASTVGTNLSALAADPSYLSGIGTMDDISTATTKLQQATAPITTACQDS
jgi:hypothetical protein